MRPSLLSCLPAAAAPVLSACCYSPTLLLLSVLLSRSALRAELAAVKAENEKLSSGLKIDEMNKELADEIETNKKLQAEIEKLKGKCRKHQTAWLDRGLNVTIGRLRDEISVLKRALNKK